MIAPNELAKPSKRVAAVGFGVDTPDMIVTVIFRETYTVSIYW